MKPKETKQRKLKRVSFDPAVSTGVALEERGGLYRNPRPIKFKDLSGSKMTIFGVK